MGRAFHNSAFRTERQRPVYLMRESAGGSRTRAGAMQLDLYLPDVHGRRMVIDAEYKTRVSPGNLQQMVIYCMCTGARDAVFVFPAWHLERCAAVRARVID